MNPEGRGFMDINMKNKRQEYKDHVFAKIKA